MKAQTLPLVIFVFAMLTFIDRGIAQFMPGSNSFVKPPASSPAMPRSLRPFSRIGIASHAGLGGIGVDVATAMARKFNLRAGSEFFRYSTTSVDQGADIAISLRMQSGHASLDWFPLGGSFRLSPLIVFTNNNRVRTTALVPPGESVNDDGGFQQSLAAFTARNKHTLSYASFFPVFSFGFGYSFKLGK